MPKHQQIQQSKDSNLSSQRRTNSASQTHVSNPAAIIQRARINSKSLTPADVMQLQRAIGNKAVGRLLSGTGRLPSTAQQTPIQRQGIPEEEEPLQAKRENNTGMLDNLKAGVENLSGIDMSDVRVHYNSSKPGEIEALAYTQGADIHFAPGQEQYLPHEVWHVVQQKQGRVHPTMQMKGGIAVNDDESLEREADMMGERAMKMNTDAFLPIEGTPQLGGYNNVFQCQTVKTMGGTWDATEYRKAKDGDPGVNAINESLINGVRIKLEFIPEDPTDADCIGISQAVKTEQKDSADISSNPFSSRLDGNKGYQIDQVISDKLYQDLVASDYHSVRKISPLYAGSDLAPGGPGIVAPTTAGSSVWLPGTPSIPGYSQISLGTTLLSRPPANWAYSPLRPMSLTPTPGSSLVMTPGLAPTIPTIKSTELGTDTEAYLGRNGKRVRRASSPDWDIENAKIEDTPFLYKSNPSGAPYKSQSQLFEDTAIAVSGHQKGTYYGSVSWGWSANSTGNLDIKPLEVVSNSVPGLNFLSAAQKWNQQPDLLNLPEVEPVNVTFRVGYQTKPGQDIFVCGSINDLGNWNENRSVKLYFQDMHHWSRELALNGNLSTQRIQYKYIMKQDGLKPRWEEGSNHERALPIKGGHDTFEDSWQE